MASPLPARLSMRLLAIAGALPLGASLLSRHSALGELRQYSFGKFVEDFGKTYQPGTAEWAQREEIFTKNMDEVIAFRAGGSRSWSKGITKFLDFSHQEFKTVLGYRGRKNALMPSSIAGEAEIFRASKEPKLPSSIDVAANLTLGRMIKDQGSCGSCWAVAATSVMEAHMEKDAQLMQRMSLVTLSEASPAQPGKPKYPALSVQAVVSCTENPKHCGGEGGCSGATAELAFEMVQRKGLPLEVNWAYTSGQSETPQCADAVFRRTRLGISGYNVLASNKISPLKHALVAAGAPVVASVDASYWAFYTEGIYTDDGQDQFTVNHAVALMGYQDPAPGQQGYWSIKNSWGNSWGEKGFIRLEMKVNEEQHCGWDYKTHEGLACDGDPDSAWVCGTCGVLYDSSYPTGLFLMDPASK